MSREVLTLNIGEGGINFGDTVWRQYNTEHGIDQYGNVAKQTNPNVKLLNFYNETKSGKYIPRTLMIDTDCNRINELKQSYHSYLYDAQYLLSLHNDEDCVNNFARGHYTVGKELIDDINDSLRNMIETFDNLDGFIINHSVGGGTGSGLTALILERLAVDYRKKNRTGYPIYPFYEDHMHLNSDCAVEPYNALLSTHWLLDHNDTSIVFDNRKIYDLCKNKLNIPLPSYNDMNLLMAKIESSLTRPLRFEYDDADCVGAQSRSNDNKPTLNGWTGCMVAFPRLHFIVASLAPLFDKKRYAHSMYIPNAGNKGKLLIDGFVRLYYNSNFLMDSVQHFESLLYQDIMDLIYKNFSKNYPKKNLNEILNDVSNEDFWMIKCEDYDCELDEYTEIVINCHGEIKSRKTLQRECYQCFRTDRKISFVPAMGCGWRCLMENRPIVTLPDDTLCSTSLSLVTFANGMPIGRFFQRTIAHKYDLMYSQRAFVHWYVGEGMEEGEFAEARDDLCFLVQDYAELHQRGSG